MIKKIIYGLLWIIILFLTLFTFDLTNFDTKYHNRGILSIDVKNLNSIYSKKFSNYFLGGTIITIMVIIITIIGITKLSKVNLFKNL